MNLLSTVGLRKLISEQERPCISIYMPTIRAGDETRQNPIRFKNLLNAAEERLIALGYRRPEAKALLEPAQELLVNELFWQHQSDGFAMFLSGDTTRHYRLPLEFEELLVVGDSFHIKPLLPLFTANGRFFILALSQQGVRLLEGTRFSFDELDLEEVPESLAEALRWDDPEAQLQQHASEGASTGGERTVMFHGHGVGADDQKTNILRFFHVVNDALQNFLGEEDIPLVLAGVDYLLPIYREANSYNNLQEEWITGNPEELKAEELHQAAWNIVEPYFKREQAEAAGIYQQVQGSDRASDDIRKIVPAAHYGQVQQLFVLLDVHQWGLFDPDTGEVQMHEAFSTDGADLIDLAASHTFLNGGKVYAFNADEAPLESAAAAVLRWPD